MARVARLAAMVVLAAFVCGCGGGELWARWRAERALWHARREQARAEASGSAVTSAQLEHVRGAYERVARGFPPARWVPRAGRDTLARDVARLSAIAATSAAVMEARLGRLDAAGAALERIAGDYAHVWPAAFDAELTRAALFEASGDSARALDPWERAARLAPVIDPDSARVCDRGFLATTRVADAHRVAGRTAAVDSLWESVTVAIDAALRVHTGDSLAPALWIRRADALAAHGGAASLEAARVALGHALRERAGAPYAHEAMLRLGEVALAAGQPDSAIVWARRASELEGPPERERSADLEVRAWQAAGRLDSAAAALDRLAATRHLPLGVATLALYREGLLLEQIGRWELARTAYHTVVASDPLSPSAFDALERMTRHHLEEREPALAEQEGRAGLEVVERTLTTVRDPDVRIRALQTRARLLDWIGDEQAAVEAYADLWQTAPDRPEGVEAGFQAAVMAAHLNDPVRAVNLYADLARRAPRAATRDSARRAGDELATAKR